MKSVWISFINLITLQMVLTIRVRPSSQENINCIPIENCSSLISLLEKSNYSPEAQEFLKVFRCRSFRESTYFWCPDSISYINQFGNEGKYQQDKVKHTGDLTIRSTSTSENEKQHHVSNGFIWGTTPQYVDTTIKFKTSTDTEVTTKNTVLSGDRILPFVKRATKNIENEAFEVEDRIYFPDEELPKFTRKAKSHVLNKLSSNCGRPFYQNFESSANNSAGLGEFPWVALLAYNVGGATVPNCAGTLISSRHVLTTATCLHQSDSNQWDLGELLQVILGELDTTTPRDCVKLPFGERCGDPAVKLGVKSFMVHSGFRGILGENDMAILKLEKEVEFSDFIMPICLPKNDFIIDPEIDIVMADWQQIDNRNEHILKKSEIHMSRSRINPIDADGFCTSFPGSPLMFRKHEEEGSPYYLIRIDTGGVKSKSCGGEQTSSIFVPRFRNWIDQNLD